MPGLKHQIEEAEGSNVFVDANDRFTNQVGTPLVSVTVIDRGNLIAGVYLLTFTAVVPGVSATCKVQAASANNPNNDALGKAVVLDGATEANDLIQGLAIVFSNNAGFLGTWQAQIRVGLDLGKLPAFGPTAGTPGTARTHRVVNDGTRHAEGCKAMLRTVTKLRDKVGEVFASIGHHAAGAVTKLLAGRVMPYAVMVENFAAGAPSTMRIKFDGALVNVRKVSDGTTGTSDNVSAGEKYVITDGDLEDLEFTPSPNASNATTANILVYSAALVQIAPDVGGAAGAWVEGDGASVTLTESGQNAGIITAGGPADFHTRPKVPLNSNTESNPYQCDIEISAQVSGSAGWDE